MKPAEATIPTSHGDFRFVVFPGEDIALVRGDVTGDDVLVRVHSECMTSEVFGSLKCECALQLDLALERIEARGRGVLVYLRQEGRGIGLANKIRAYALQEKGLDTVDANRALGLPDDARRYDAAAKILDALDVRSIELMTNNPAKVTALNALGVIVRREMPHIVVTPPSAAIAYLETKRARMDHVLQRAST